MSVECNCCPSGQEGGEGEGEICEQTCSIK